MSSNSTEWEAAGAFYKVVGENLLGVTAQRQEEGNQ